MKTSNILRKSEELSDEQYSLYDTRIKNKVLVSTQLVGNIYYSEKVSEGSICRKGDVLLEVHTLGVTYEYISFKDIKVVKKYCPNGGIVDYNKPILLMERMES